MLLVLQMMPVPFLKIDTGLSQSNEDIMSGVKQIATIHHKSGGLLLCSTMLSDVIDQIRKMANIKSLLHVALPSNRGRE